MDGEAGGGGARAAVRAAAAAVAFLTRIPVGRGMGLTGTDVARGTALFPLVGAAVGAAAGAVAALLHGTVGVLPAAALAVAVDALLTGGLHYDALADAADGAGGRTREDALRIMRDPRVGSHGVLALVLDVVTRVA
ncbi:MAG: adenosylcobinamide-GDP ribazoletransferase, partial [Actinomycetota bacterium]